MSYYYNFKKISLFIYLFIYLFVIIFLFLIHLFNYIDLSIPFY